MIIIDISKDFSPTPGARNYSDGPDSGHEFYDKILRNSFIEAIEAKVKLKIILDGTEGYASSFLNEAFSLLGSEFGPDRVWNNLIIVSEEIPKYISKIKESVYEKRK
jgi:hypothetical protein